MFCRSCGAKLPDDSRFCTNCGATINYAPTQPALGQPATVIAPAPTAMPKAVRDPRRTGSALFLLALLGLTAEFLISFGVEVVYFIRAVLNGFYPRMIVDYGISFVGLFAALMILFAAWLVFIKTKKKTDPIPFGGALTIMFIVVVLRLAWTLLYPVIRFIYNSIEYSGITYYPSFFYYPLICALLYVFAFIAIIAIKKGKTNATVVIAAILCFVRAAADIISEIEYYSGIASDIQYFSVGDVILTALSSAGLILSVAATVLFGILLLKYNSAARAARN